MAWNTISLATRMIGFIVLFLGTIFFILGTTPGGGCYGNFSSPQCLGNTTWEGGQANWVLIGKLLWAVGLFFIAIGIGMKVHFALQWPASGKPEEATFIAAERRMNYLLLALILVLLLVIVTPLITFATPPG